MTGAVGDPVTEQERDSASDAVTESTGAADDRRPPSWVAVSGVGRSGTSLVMQVLEGLGARISTDVVPASDDNPAGFLEANDVVAVHDGLVTDLGVDPVIPLAATWIGTPAFAHARRALAGIVGRELQRPGVWAVKDPRMGLFWPVWEGVIEDVGERPGVIWCTRNSAPVVASLVRAYGMGRATAEGLVVTRSLVALESLPPSTCFVPYEGWWVDVDHQLDVLGDASGLGTSTSAGRVVGERVRDELDREGAATAVRSGALRELDEIQRTLAGVVGDRTAIDEWCSSVRTSYRHLDFLARSAQSRGAAPVGATRRRASALRSVLPPSARSRIRTARDRIRRDRIRRER